MLLCDWMLGWLRDKNGKSEIPGGPLLNFCALFGESKAIYGHFLLETVMSEESIHISSSDVFISGIDNQSLPLQTYHKSTYT